MTATEIKTLIGRYVLFDQKIVLILQIAPTDKWVEVCFANGFQEWVPIEKITRTQDPFNEKDTN